MKVIQISLYCPVTSATSLSNVNAVLLAVLLVVDQECTLYHNHILLNVTYAPMKRRPLLGENLFAMGVNTKSWATTMKRTLG
tara:strand:+ start:300 stop:545 length:246 start_codon:yes stop_codon:yes gene_type:complete